MKMYCTALCPMFLNAMRANIDYTEFQSAFFTYIAIKKDTWIFFTRFEEITALKFSEHEEMNLTHTKRRRSNSLPSERPRKSAQTPILQSFGKKSSPEKHGLDSLGKDFPNIGVRRALVPQLLSVLRRLDASKICKN